MKKFALAALAVLMLGVTPVSAAVVPVVTSASAADKSHIIVDGTGTVKVKPDIAVLNVGVTTSGETTAVQQENVEIMNKVMDAVKEAGVSEADIQTSSYYLSPNYDYGVVSSYSTYVAESAPRITGYTMYHTIEVKVRDVSLAGDILSKATDAGANVNNGVSFSLSDPDTYYLQALEKAMANAKAKAEIIAATLGKTVGTPITVTESGSSASLYYSNYNMRNNFAMDTAVAAGAAAPVESGMLEVSASVSVQYAE